MRPNTNIASLACFAIFPLFGPGFTGARAAVPELTWLSDVRTSSAELTTVCDGTTSDSASDSQIDPLYPFEALVQTMQECPTGNTTGHAASLLQSQLYTSEVVQDTPVTSLPQGEAEWSLFFWVSRLGDADSDGNVDFADLLDVLGASGACVPDVPCVTDLNADGVVNFADVLQGLGNWD